MSNFVLIPDAVLIGENYQLDRIKHAVVLEKLNGTFDIEIRYKDEKPVCAYGRVIYDCESYTFNFNESQKIQFVEMLEQHQIAVARIIETKPFWWEFLGWW